MYGSKYYIAYGSNLNLEQMAMRCPTAKIAGYSQLTDYRLRFRGGSYQAYATVEKHKGSTVPVLIWALQPQDEHQLDIYEGYPTLYRKEILPVELNGETVKAMIYIMNEALHPYGHPSDAYFSIIAGGYSSAGFAFRPLYCSAYCNQIDKE